MHADRNLLFGILALQMDFINRDQLVAGMHAWVLDKARPLGQILVEQQVLSPEDQGLLDTVVARHLSKHDEDAARSLAALSALESARLTLRSLDDAEVQASLSPVSTRRQATDTGSPKTAFDHQPLRFRVLRSHARGGIGEVFVAEDRELHREVALKEIQDHHADQATSRARFLIEAQITTGLEHPGIVPVYSLGTYPDGRPFYAMRLIRGESLKDAITQYHARLAAERQCVVDGLASVECRQLLRRFIDLCNAVAYAHSRGVIHRDLKPANVMLGPFGETLVVDWGLAKATGAGGQGLEPGLNGERLIRPQVATVVEPTQMGDAVGTPAYMSPEQAAGRLDLVGPASDVYSLGATLWTLLTNRLPVQGAHVGEVLKLVESGRTSLDDPVLASPNPRFAPLLAICRKAMSRLPQQRYGSPSELAAELENWLADEPIKAYPEPWTRRLGRWSRRHRTLTASLLVFLMVSSVMAGVIVALRAEERARAERRDAEYRLQRMQLEADKEVASLDAARQKKSSADMQAFVTDLFKSADPVGLSGLGLRKARSQMSLREVLDYGAQAAADRLADQPLVQASLQETLGNIDRSVGNYERAEELLTKSAATRRGLLPADDPELARSQFHLGWLRQDQGRLEEAETIFRKCLAIQIKHYGEEHLDVAATKFNLGWLLTLHYEEGTGVGSPRIKEAIQLLQASLQTRRDLLGDAHPLVADTLIGLGFACYGTEERSEYGLKLTLQAAEIFGARGEKDHLVINLQKLLKVQNLRNQDKPRAIALLKEVVAEARIILGNEHFMTAMALGHLAGIQREVNDFDGAEASIREALAIGRKVFPKGHPLMIEALQELARHLRERGNEAESADLLREAEVIAKRFLRPESSLRQRIEEDIAKFAPRGK